MSCKCSPSLVRLMAAFAARGHVNSGCCGDAAHQARKSDHNPDSSGYAHAQDIHELADHDMQPYVDFIMANPPKFGAVKYLIYERIIYYPHPSGSHRPGPYAYTGPNPHAQHLHVSIFADATFYAGSWYVDEAYGAHTPIPPVPEEDDMKPYVAQAKGSYYYVDAAAVVWIAKSDTGSALTKAFGDPVAIDDATFAGIAGSRHFVDKP